MNCPVCGEALIKARRNRLHHRSHHAGKYTIWYENTGTYIYDYTKGNAPYFVMHIENKLVVLDVDRIEKLLLLK